MVYPGQAYGEIKIEPTMPKVLIDLSESLFLCAKYKLIPINNTASIDPGTNDPNRALRD